MPKFNYISSLLADQDQLDQLDQLDQDQLDQLRFTCFLNPSNLSSLGFGLYIIGKD